MGGRRRRRPGEPIVGPEDGAPLPHGHEPAGPARHGIEPGAGRHRHRRPIDAVGRGHHGTVVAHPHKARAAPHQAVETEPGPRGQGSPVDAVLRGGQEPVGAADDEGTGLAAPKGAQLVPVHPEVHRAPGRAILARDHGALGAHGQEAAGGPARLAEVPRGAGVLRRPGHAVGGGEDGPALTDSDEPTLGEAHAVQRFPPRARKGSPLHRPRSCVVGQDGAPPPHGHTRSGGGGITLETGHPQEVVGAGKPPARRLPTNPVRGGDDGACLSHRDELRAVEAHTFQRPDRAGLGLDPGETAALRILLADEDGAARAHRHEEPLPINDTVGHIPEIVAPAAGARGRRPGCPVRRAEDEAVPTHRHVEAAARRLAVDDAQEGLLRPGILPLPFLAVGRGEDGPFPSHGDEAAPAVSHRPEIRRR